MAFSKAMPEAFCVTLFYGSRDNDEVEKLRVFIRRVSVAQLLAVLLCHVRSCKILQTAQHCTSLHFAII